MEEVEAIIKAAKEPYRLHKDIAQKFRVSSQLVGGLVRDSVKCPEKLAALHQRVKDDVVKKDAIEEAATRMLSINKPIVSCELVQTEAQQKCGHRLDKRFVRQVMRKDLHLGYRKAKTVAIQANSERCLVLRQQYSLRMIPLLASGKRIINVDESWLN